MVSIAQFIRNLRLSKADAATLEQHVQNCHMNFGGPSLDDRCTDRVRYFNSFAVSLLSACLHVGTANRVLACHIIQFA